MSETLDSIKIRDLEVQVYQTKSGYRFSLDALLLADFPEVRTVSRILELGAGSGVVSLLLAKRYPKRREPASWRKRLGFRALMKWIAALLLHQAV